MPDGRPVRIFTLVNSRGMEAQVTDLGANLVSLKAPDRMGRLEDIVLGFGSAEEYLADGNLYLGATAGRFGNRIARGRFVLDGRPYQLATNNAPGGIPCHLHGGKTGFNRRLWEVVESAPSSITFRHVSPDGEEGYPGTLTATVGYEWNDDNELKWEASAVTDRPTIVNIIHHPYWNLSGDPSVPIGGHVLTIPAARYLPTDAGLIPTGELAPVDGTPMDFTRPLEIRCGLERRFQALEHGFGYDHCWVLDAPAAEGLSLAAKLECPGSGRVLEVFTNRPAVQFYSGNFLDGSVRGKCGVAYKRRSGLCLETEWFPDAPNHPLFPCTVLRPGGVDRHTAVYRFSIR